MKRNAPRSRRGRSVALTLTLAAAALVAPAAADAAKYKGKASGYTIRFNQKGKRISKIRTLVFVVCTSTQGGAQDSGTEFFDPPGKFKLGKSTRKTAHRKAAVRPGEYG